MIACLDVDYRDSRARAACVLLESWSSQVPAHTYVADIADVRPYEPGSFYLRELPCLLSVLRLLSTMPKFLVVDGYVWVSADGEAGLGAHLHAAVHEASPVIGVAKTEFIKLRGSPLVELVYRGGSKKPLFVTSVGIGIQEAGARVRSMHGAHRIPEPLRLADRVSRNTGAIADDTRPKQLLPKLGVDQ